MKHGKLKFTVQAENLKKFEVHWQITNTGSEAEKGNSLRGDFYESEIIEGKRVRKEDTLYLGTHYVEAYLVKNNICYGKSKPFVIKITDETTFGWLQN